MAIASLGPRKSGEPSMCDWKATPSSLIFAIFAKLKT
jgi:hypothetical protein